MERFFRGNMFTVVLIAVLAVRSIMNNNFFNDPLGWLIDILLLVPGIIIGITVHEYAHALAAYKLGDMTPKYQKRVSLNPVRHIDPIGFVALLLIGFGWGKPVEVNPYAFKNSRRSNLITDVAGIATNFVFAFIFMGLTSLFVHTVGVQAGGITGNAFVYYTCQVLVNIVIMNLVLMIFNLLPVPPLDGFGIITEIFNLRGKPIYNQLYAMGFPLLILLIVLNVPSRVISPVINAIFTLLENIFF
jgi:Zn-dependent protease